MLEYVTVTPNDVMDTDSLPTAQKYFLPLSYYAMKANHTR
jgi:hypothetical protein